MNWLANIKFDFQHTLGVAWSAFAMIYILLITFATVPVANQRYADTIVGFLLGTVVATIINYFFGSSKSSADKNATINGMIADAKDTSKPE